jgi:hypothetical protein
MVNWDDTDPSQDLMNGWLQSAAYCKYRSGSKRGIDDFFENYVLKPHEQFDPNDPKMTPKEAWWLVHEYWDKLDGVIGGVDDLVTNEIGEQVQNIMPAKVPAGGFEFLKHVKTELIVQKGVIHGIVYRAD